MSDRLREEVAELEAAIAAHRAELAAAQAAHRARSERLSRLKNRRAELTDKIAISAWAECEEMERPKDAPSRAEMWQKRQQ